MDELHVIYVVFILIIYLKNKLLFAILIILLKKKMQDNHQTVVKELQNSSSQISENVHKISFNFYKSCDQKLEDLKSTFERSIQSISYSLTHCNRDIKEAKEDVSYMKNKVPFFVLFWNMFDFLPEKLSTFLKCISTDF